MPVARQPGDQTFFTGGIFQVPSMIEKTVLAEKLRNLTPGCEELIERWGLVEKR